VNKKRNKNWDASWLNGVVHRHPWGSRSRSRSRSLPRGYPNGVHAFTPAGSCIYPSGFMHLPQRVHAFTPAGSCIYHMVFVIYGLLRRVLLRYMRFLFHSFSQSLSLRRSRSRRSRSRRSLFLRVLPPWRRVLLFLNIRLILLYHRWVSMSHSVHCFHTVPCCTLYYTVL